MVRRIFIRYAPLFFFLPFSLAVGVYCFIKFDLLYAVENRLFFYYYVILTAFPVIFVFVKVKPDFGEGILEIFNEWVERFWKNKWLYALFVLLTSLLFMVIAKNHISTFTERDRWVLEDDIPVIPIDLPIPLRLAWALNLALPMDLAVPVIGLASMLLWFAFLVHVHGKQDGQGYLVLLVFAATFFNKAFFELLYANLELPSAIVAWIGLYAIWKRRISLGFMFVIFSTVLKNTGIFQVAVALILLGVVLYQDQHKKGNILQGVDLLFVFVLFVYFALSYWGNFYYMFVVRDGPGYIFESGSQRIFWLSSFIEFLQILLKDYSLVLVPGLLGLAFGSMGIFPFLSVGMLFFLRSFSSLSMGYYPLVFLPGLSFFSGFGFQRVLDTIKPRLVRSLAISLLLGIAVIVLVNLIPHYPFWMYRYNSNFDEFIRYTAKNFPENGMIYQREISLLPYLSAYRKNDLDNIEFRYYPEDKQALLFDLGQPGCKMIIMQIGDLGVTRDELLSLGYSDTTSFHLESKYGRWSVYTKECE